MYNFPKKVFIGNQTDEPSYGLSNVSAWRTCNTQISATISIIFRLHWLLYLRQCITHNFLESLPSLTCSYGGLTRLCPALVYTVYCTECLKYFFFFVLTPLHTLQIYADRLPPLPAPVMFPPLDGQNVGGGGRGGQIKFRPLKGKLSSKIGTQIFVFQTSSPRYSIST